MKEGERGKETTASEMMQENEMVRRKAVGQWEKGSSEDEMPKTQKRRETTMHLPMKKMKGMALTRT